MPQNNNSIRDAIQQGQFVCSVEINPPVGSFDLEHLIQITNKLYQAGVNTINIADGPRALLRMSNSAMGQVIKQNTPVNPMLHVCCRDKSFLGLQAHLLGLHVLGFRDLCIVTGDPPNLGNYPNSTGVYDLDSVKLLQLIQNYNLGIDPVGELMPATDFYCGTGVEPAAIDYIAELDRLKRKQDVGAQFVMTQPIYDLVRLDKFLNDTSHLGLPVLLGLCPLVSYKNAIYVNEKIRGMAVPSHVLQRMQQHDSKETGIMIAKEILQQFKDRIQGVYFMPQLKNYDMVLEILK